MQKYGFREGQGLGKHEQGLSTALSVEKTSKRGGKIIIGDSTEKSELTHTHHIWEDLILSLKKIRTCKFNFLILQWLVYVKIHEKIDSVCKWVQFLKTHTHLPVYVSLCVFSASGPGQNAADSSANAGASGGLASHWLFVSCFSLGPHILFSICDPSNVFLWGFPIALLIYYNFPTIFTVDFMI